VVVSPGRDTVSASGPVSIMTVATETLDAIIWID
jgi:hypothetical protein